MVRGLFLCFSQFADVSSGSKSGGGALAPSDIIGGVAGPDVDPNTGLAYLIPTTVAELQAMVAVEVTLASSSVPVDVHDEAKEEALVPAEDILDPHAYSIQDAKLKTEEDKRAQIAELRKGKMRAAIRVRLS